VAYTVPFVKVNLSGHFGSSTTDIVEKWQAGFHITKNGGVIGGTTELTNFLGQVGTLAKTFHAATTTGVGGSCFLSEASGAYIGTDGKYALGALQTTTRVPITPVTAGNGTSALPWATSMVWSLRSLLTRGPASHGRVYYPHTNAPLIATTGRLALAQQQSYATAVTTFLNGVNLAASGSFGSGSNVGLVSPAGSGFQSPVVRFGIGAKPDHMESRERDLPESYVFQTTTNSLLLLEELDDEFRDRMREEFPDSV
jgi:hypothetical protein